VGSESSFVCNSLMILLIPELVFMCGFSVPSFDTWLGICNSFGEMTQRADSFQAVWSVRRRQRHEAVTSTKMAPLTPVMNICSECILRSYP
jgi:hypothetical protein